jgi:hypothetical protein
MRCLKPTKTAAGERLVSLLPMVEASFSSVASAKSWGQSLLVQFDDLQPIRVRRQMLVAMGSTARPNQKYRFF